jgi:hypothetical protein
MEPHLLKTGAYLATIFVLYTLARYMYQYSRRSALRQASGAQSAKHFPQWDRVIGFDMFRDSLSAFREHRMLQRSQERFAIVGRMTYEVLILGRSMIMTLEPENLKVIQALDHKKWHLGERRKTSFKPLLGDGKAFQSLDSLFSFWPLVAIYV